MALKELVYTGDKRCRFCIKATEETVDSKKAVIEDGIYSQLEFSHKINFIRGCILGRSVSTDAEFDKCISKLEFRSRAVALLATANLT
jgi:hypothetical protein